MKISAELLNEETRILASQILEDGQSKTLEIEQLDTDVYRSSSIDSRRLRLGRTAVQLGNFVEAPESGSVYDGPSGSVVSLIFDRRGELKSIKDVPVGYDALWGLDTLADTIIPTRRKAKQARIARKAEYLIQATAKRFSEN